MDKKINKYKEEILNKDFILSSASALLLLIISLIINYYAGSFATHNVSNSVTDIILDNIKTRDVEMVFIYGTLAFWIGTITILLIKPKRIPFVLKSIALFIFIRSASISLTHIAPFAEQINIPDNRIIHYFTFGGDLFFSGHTGLPFLLALIFWDHRIIRYVYLLTSITFAVIVLAGHYHYSIDVFAAFFITPTIMQLCNLFFDRDHNLFRSYN